MRQTFRMNGHAMTRALVGAQALADAEPPAVAAMGLAMIIRKLMPIVEDLEITRGKRLARAKSPEEQAAAGEELEQLYNQAQEITVAPVRWDQFGDKGANGKHFAHLGPLGLFGDEAADGAPPSAGA